MTEVGLRFLRYCRERYLYDPVLFAKEVLGVEFTGQQKQALEALVETRRVVISSGHGTGKSCMQAISILWFMCTRPNCRCVATSPTARQLNTILWSEVSIWYNNSILSEMDLFEINKEKMVINDKNYAKSWFAVPVSVSKPENIQGYHSKSLLVILDESSGLENEILEVLEGALSGDGEDDHEAYLLTAGNPTKNTGLLYSLMHEHADRYSCFVFNCEDSPRVSRKWIKEMEDKYGREHDVYRVRVRGLFPKSNTFSVLSREDVRNAMMRKIEPDGKSKISLGVDIASSGGDRSAISVVQGNVELERKIFYVESTTEIADVIESLVKKYKYYCGEIEVKVDSTGMGVSFCDFLEERNLPITLTRINFSQKAQDREAYSNVVTEMFFTFRERIEEISLIEDRELEEELCGREFLFDSSTRYKVERKEDFRKRIGRSPDAGDAVLLAFYNPFSNSILHEKEVSWV